MYWSVTPLDKPAVEAFLDGESRGGASDARLRRGKGPRADHVPVEVAEGRAAGERERGAGRRRVDQRPGPRNLRYRSEIPIQNRQHQGPVGKGVEFVNKLQRKPFLQLTV